MIKRLGTVTLAIGSGLGVWVITNLADVGAIDLLIVMALIVLGSILVNVKPPQD